MPFPIFDFFTRLKVIISILNNLILKYRINDRVQKVEL